MLPRQVDGEDGPAPRAVGGADAAAVQLDQVLDDGEAEAGAAGIALAAGARLVDAVEALEDARQVGVGNAAALVGDGEPDRDRRSGSIP